MPHPVVHSLDTRERRHADALRVCLISSMRDAGPYLPHWRRMVERFTHQPAHIVVAENDSTDDTLAQLDAWPTVTIERFTTGEEKLPREASARRSDYLARCWNRAIDRALTLEWDVALCVSAQKFLPSDTLARLLRHDADIVAPLVLRPDGFFYDTWCFRHRGGAPFTDLDRVMRHELVDVDAVGGCYIVPRAVYEAGCRLLPTDGSCCESVPFCGDARAKGFRVALDRSLYCVAAISPEEFAGTVSPGTGPLEAVA